MGSTSSLGLLTAFNGSYSPTEIVAAIVAIGGSLALARLAFTGVMWAKKAIKG